MDDLSRNQSEISFIEILNVLWKGKIYIFSLVTVFLLLSIFYVILATPLYRSSITLYSLNDSGQSGTMANMARQLGVFGNTGVLTTTYNIPDVVKSRTLSEKILLHEWEIEGYDKKVSLVKYFDDIRGSKKPDDLVTEEDVREWNQDKLHSYGKFISRKRVSVSINPETNLITVSVDMEQPELARDIANFISLFVSNWVNENQKVSAQKNLEFINNRLVTAEKQLIQAENDLKTFKDNNRSIINSPDLQLELQRLQRQLLIKQEVYLTLVKQKEIVQIEENKDSDVVRIVDRAIKEKKQIKPNKKLSLAIGFLLGISFGIFSLTSLYFMTDRYKKINLNKRNVLNKIIGLQ